MKSRTEEIVQRAKDGDPQAISLLLNHYFQIKNIKIKVVRKNSDLQILLMSDKLINQDSTVKSIRNGFLKLQPRSVGKLRLYAKQIDKEIPDWTYEIDLHQAESIEVKDNSFKEDNTQSYSVLQAEDFRVSGEQELLYISLAIAGFIALILLSVSLGLILLVIAVSAFWIKIQQGQLLGGSVKVSSKQFFEINSQAQTAAKRLCMKMPDVFIKQSPTINAFATGFLDDRYTVVLHSTLVEALTQDEIIFILGHEFSHIKCGHTNFLLLTDSAENFAQIPFVSNILGFIFLWWSRKGEYTCDRGGLIACRNLNAAISALAKLSIGRELFEQMDLEALLDQRHEFNSNDAAKISELFGTHPSIVHRIHALKTFYDSPEYKKLSLNS